MHGNRDLSPAMASGMVNTQNSCAVPPLGHAMAGLNHNMRTNVAGPTMAAMAAMAGTTNPNAMKMPRYMPPNVMQQQVSFLFGFVVILQRILNQNFFIFLLNHVFQY